MGAEVFFPINLKTIAFKIIACPFFKVDVNMTAVELP